MKAILRACWLAALLLAAMPHARSEAPPVVAAASDLQFALAEAAEAFTRSTGRPVKLAFGSSGNFQRQIRQGAPYQLFLSADERYVLDLARLGLTDGDGTLYAIGRIVLLVPHGSRLRADGTLADLRAALGDGRLRKFAIANPEHAPYGARAKEALQHAGLWVSIEPRLLLGENVSQAAQFATAGGSDGGIVAYSLVRSPKVAARGEYALIPADWHAPLRQRMALVKGAGATARSFYDYLQQPAARAILERHGFTLPDGAS